MFDLLANSKTNKAIRLSFLTPAVNKRVVIIKMGEDQYMCLLYLNHDVGSNQSQGTCLFNAFMFSAQ